MVDECTVELEMSSLFYSVLSFRNRYGGTEVAGVNLKRSAINNSLLDLTENHNMLPYPGFNVPEKPTRRGSVGSLGE